MLRDPDRVALAYTEDSEWRNRGEFIRGRDAIREVREGFVCGFGIWVQARRSTHQLDEIVTASWAEHTAALFTHNQPEAGRRFSWGRRVSSSVVSHAVP